VRKSLFDGLIAIEALKSAQFIFLLCVDQITELLFTVIGQPFRKINL